MIQPETIQNWNDQLADQPLTDVLEFVLRLFDLDEITFACSFGLEDMLVLHHLLQINPKARVFYLDTGRLHPETYELIAQSEQFYQRKFDAYYPDAAQLEGFVRKKGINGFYQSIEARKQCCALRKVVPLGRALQNKRAWITGLRRQQSPARRHLKLLEQDERGLLKVNPLYQWTEKELLAAVAQGGFPTNSLHDKGYPSIGCAPCTRPVPAGADIRQGRFWWEETTKKECGLHLG